LLITRARRDLCVSCRILAKPDFFQEMDRTQLIVRHGRDDWRFIPGFLIGDEGGIDDWADKGAYHAAEAGFFIDCGPSPGSQDMHWPQPIHLSRSY
jgi:hypothetical protein